MNLRSVVAACVVAVALAGTASANVVFYDNFDSYNGGAGQTNFSNFGGTWTVKNGTVDLIGNGLHDFLQGNGLYIDLDGSSYDAGEFVSKTLNLAPGSYELRFDLAGNHRNSTDSATATVTVGIASVSANYTLVSSAPFQQMVIPFTVSGIDPVTLSFQAQSNDNIGLLLDNVEVAAVPLPAASWAGLGLIGILAVAKRLRHRA